jgi:hypothetical protein
VRRQQAVAGELGGSSGVEVLRRAPTTGGVDPEQIDVPAARERVTGCVRDDLHRSMKADKVE